MAPASALSGALRSALGQWTRRLAGAPAFRNAGLAVLAAVSAVVAAEPFEGQPAPAAPVETRPPVETPQYLPTYTPPTAEPPPATPPTAEAGRPQPPAPAANPNSVLLPPIQTPTAESKATPQAQPAPAGAGVRAPSLADPPPAVSTPQKTAPESTLEVTVGQARVVAFPDVPQRVALAVDEKDPVATLKEVPHKAREWYVFGKKPGTAFLDVWLPDVADAASYRVQHYLIRVVPPPDTNAHLDTVYDELEREINRTFPGSSVRLKRVGDKLVVSGTARNVFEATRILAVARENAPAGAPESAAKGLPVLEPTRPAAPSLQATLDDYAKAGGPHVVNLLRIPGEQQVMLRVVVAEVNRSAARSLGLDFGLDERRATILGNRPGDGSSTLVDNGWIGQALRTLQERGYSRTLAEPALTALNGQSARFQAGGEFPVPVVTPSPTGAVQGVSFRSYGVQLRMQPVVSDTNRIRLTVDADVSTTDPAATAQVAGTAVPGLKVRNFQSTVELREGETLAVAGLIRSGGPAPTETAAPAEASSAEQELVVLISPLLLASPGADGRAARNHNPYNPQDVELYLRSRNVHLPRGDALYLIGPQGYAGESRTGPQR